MGEGEVRQVRCSYPRQAVGGRSDAETAASCLRQVDFLGEEIKAIDREIAKTATSSPDFQRLMTIPGVDIGTAAAVMAAIGDIRRFKTPQELVAYLGLDPTSRQSGEKPAVGGRISKRGNPHARSVLVEAAWTAIRSPGPLHAFAERVRARRGANKAAVAVARKLTVICWHLLTTEQDYAFGRPSLTRKKMRRIELTAGAPRLARNHQGPPVNPTAEQKARERALQHQAELAYRRLVEEWSTTGKTTSDQNHDDHDARRTAPRSPATTPNG